MPRSIKRPKQPKRPTTRELLLTVGAILLLCILLPFLVYRPTGNAVMLHGVPTDTSHVTAASIDNEIRSGLKLGSALSEVEQFLAVRTIEHSFDKDSNTVLAAVRQLRGGDRLVSQTITFKFHFDQNQRLTSIENELVYTGP